MAVEGPRAIASSELADLSELVDSIFMGRDAGTMFEQFPRLFHADRLEQMRVVVRDGRVLAHVGMLLEPASLLGCETTIATIGAVCCRREERGQGHATALMRDCLAIARAAGAPLMMISGGRGLYRRLGAQHGGQFARWDLPVAALPDDDAALTLHTVAPGRCGAVLRLAETEPIRWHRDAVELGLMLRSGVVACRLGSTHLILRGDEPLAAITVSVRANPEEGWTRLNLVELAGSRAAALAVLGRLAAQYQATHVRIHRYRGDRELAEQARRPGWQPAVDPVEGTLRVVDLDRLLEDFAPLLRDRLGESTRSRLALRLEESGDTYTALRADLDGESLVIDGDQAIIALLFGRSGVDPLAGRGGPPADALRAAFPLPLPMYGLNYA